MSVRDLEDVLTAEELQGYMAYYDVEPWGCEAEDYRSQQLAYLTAQVQSKKSLDPADFAPPWRRPKKKIVPYEVGFTAHMRHMKMSKPKA